MTQETPSAVCAELLTDSFLRREEMNNRSEDKNKMFIFIAAVIASFRPILHCNSPIEKKNTINYGLKDFCKELSISVEGSKHR